MSRSVLWWLGAGVGVVAVASLVGAAAGEAVLTTRFVGSPETVSWVTKARRVDKRGRLAVARFQTSPWSFRIALDSVPFDRVADVERLSRLNLWDAQYKPLRPGQGWVGTMNQIWLVSPVPRETAGPYDCTSGGNKIKEAACSVNWTNLHNAEIKVSQDPVSFLIVAYWRWGLLAVGTDIDATHQSGLEAARAIAIDGESSVAVPWGAA